MGVQPARSIAFGDFELDVRAGELRKHGLRIRLQDQSFQILLMLLERPGEVVLREEIRQKLWPNNTIVEFDHSINAAIKRLRNALGESAEEPRYIETLAKRGYRFAGTVRQAKAEPPPAVAMADGDDLAGKTFSHFRVLEKLGSGGMGVVYRADDLKLGRQVALKFLQLPVDELPGSVLERFEREARAASALNHPNICTVHSTENFGGQPVIVMELLEGETLEARLARGSLPREEAIALAIQIAGALAEAHRKGIVHRDLKPANVMLTKSGVKVLDFGLAKMERPTAARDESVRQPGLVMGTLRYMSPEQARGKETDARSDIFSFGAVLFEMITRKRAFDGPDAILESDPPTVAPEALDRVVRECLKKDPDERWQSALDLKTNLEWLAAAPATDIAARARRAGRWPWAVAAFAAVAGIFGSLRPGSASHDPPAITLTIVPPSGITLRQVGNELSVPEISPDGSAVLYNTKDREYVRRLDSPEPYPVPGSEAINDSPFWSADSASVVFPQAALLLMKVRLPDGPPQVVAPAPNFSRGGNWSDHGTILISMGNLLRTSPASSGELKPVELPGALKNGSCLYPEFLPGSEDFLFMCRVRDSSAVYLASLRDGKAVDPVLLLNNQTAARYTPAGGGRVLFVRDENLYSQKLNRWARRLEGDAESVAQGVASQPGDSHGMFSVARNGTVAWRPGKAALSQVNIFDRQGNPIGIAGPFSSFLNVTLSPDERHMLASDEASWMLDVGQPGRLELPRDSRWLGWSAGGSKLIGIRKGALVEMSASGLGEVHELRKMGLGGVRSLDISPDGKQLIASTAQGLFSEQLDGSPEETKPRPIAENGALIFGPRFSPDGRWFVYQNGSPRGGLYVRPFAGPGPRRQIAPSGGRAVWRKDGKEIVYVDGQRVMSVTVEVMGNDVRFGAPSELFSGLREPALMNASSSLLAVSRDGSRIFWLQGVEQPDSNMIYVKTGWLK
jgi:serine/threonine protein kinase